MTTFELPLNKQALEDLDFFSKKDGMTVTELIMDAIRERLEDLEDVRDIEMYLAEGGGPTYTLEEVMKEFGHEV